VYLWLSPEGFDQGVLGSLSDKLQETIKKSPEYQALIAGANNKTAGAWSKQEADRILF
jgi:hypothetical protein